MAGSYRKIDYRIRPAKHIERSLFAEAFKRIPFGPLENYQYIGMGSLYFSDFRFFHKRLGITKMISFEGKAQDRDRFEYNKPFSCLDVRYGYTSVELPKVDLTIPSLIWLDYDGTLNQDVLADLKLISNNLLTGSFFSLSINSFGLYDPKDTVADNQNTALEKLALAVGGNRIPAGLKNSDLGSKGTARAYFDIIIAEIESVLTLRNAGVSENDKIEFRQVFHIRYSDGAPMLTIGGFLIAKKHRRKFLAAKYKDQEYFRGSSNPLVIKVPLLTMKEILALEKIAPTTDIGSAASGTIQHDTKAPEKDVMNFLRTYRFLPNYVPVESH